MVLEAPTGSGKSTQLPQMLLDRGVVPEGEIVVLQPRRVAARMLARRVASERRSRAGGEIGYQVRFDKVAGRDTRVLFVTEGVLLRRMLQDPKLRGVAAIVFDEFHERHLHGDVMLALAMGLQNGVRPDLKLAVGEIADRVRKRGPDQTADPVKDQVTPGDRQPPPGRDHRRRRDHRAKHRCGEGYADRVMTVDYNQLGQKQRGPPGRANGKQRQPRQAGWQGSTGGREHSKPREEGVARLRGQWPL